MPLAAIPVARPAPLLSPTTGVRPAAGAQPGPLPAATPILTVDCWSCDTPNIPSRLFCVSCGSFIAVGSGADGAAAARADGAVASHQDWRAAASHPELRASSEVHPGAPLSEASAPFVAGAMSLGSYSEASRRRASRARTLTAVTSVALTLVVGLAALYVALPRSDRSGDARTAAAGPAATAWPAATAGQRASTTATLPATAEPPAAAGLPVTANVDEPSLEPVVGPVSGVEIVTPQADGQLPASEPEVAEPEAAEPEVVEPEVVEPIVRTDEPPPDDPTAADATEGDTATSPAHGWVCEGRVQVEDSRMRDWSLGRVTFRARPGFERVVLHLERSGSGSGETPSVTAETVPTGRLNSLMPGVRRPALGRSTISLRLAGGIGGNLALRGYRPSGLVDIKEFSVYPAGMGGRGVLISTASDGCFRLRVPAWNDPSASVRRAEILIDVRS